MEKVLVVLPHSIGGRLTVNSIKDGFIQNGFEAVVFDELHDDFKDFLQENYAFIVGYDFSPVKLKIDYKFKMPCIAYFSDNVYTPASEPYYKEYFDYLKNKDIFVFHWDREVSKKENYNYLPHFVNTQIYKNYLKPLCDVTFCGRLDTDLRLETYIELNKKLPELNFRWYAIKKHFDDALKRALGDDKKIIENTYCGFIDNEEDMARVINETKIVYNINSQGETSLNYRTMQVLACERLIISDYRKELDLFENLIPVWKNINDLASKISFYINNKEKYKDITKKCCEIVKRNHNSKTGVEKILEVVTNSNSQAHLADILR